MQKYTSGTLLDPIRRNIHFEENITIKPIICKCMREWVPSIDDLKYQRSRCPFCGHNPHKMSSKFYDILYPITLNKSSLLRRGDTSLHSIDIVCGDCHKAIRVVIKTAVQRIIDNSSICWICDHRRGGRTGELFIYNYPELANRIKEEIPNVDFFLATSKKFLFEYDCGHTEQVTPKKFINNHKLCQSCRKEFSKNKNTKKKFTKRKKRKSYYKSKHCSTYTRFKGKIPDQVKAVCNTCDKAYVIKGVNFKKNFKRNKGRYICGICASSKGVSLKDKLSEESFAHVIWSDKNKFSPEEITASSARRVILNCQNGHEWSPCAYAIGGCPQCSQGGSSKEEESLFKFICSISQGRDVIRNTRDIISPKEIDIYIPSLNIAIEYNGTYWHSGRFVKNEDYHHDKWNICKNNNIKLLSVWEDDWLYRRDSVESFLIRTLQKEWSHGHSLYKQLSIELTSHIDSCIIENIMSISLFEEQYLINEADLFAICRDHNGEIVSVSSLLYYSGCYIVLSHVCLKQKYFSIKIVINHLQTVCSGVGIIECNDYPWVHRVLSNEYSLTECFSINSVQYFLFDSNIKYRIPDKNHNSSVNVWTSGYTLWTVM